MYRVPVALAIALIAAAAAAQTTEELNPGAKTTLMPGVETDDAGMDRPPDPAAGAPVDKTLPQPAAADRSDANCRVRRADSDTGFVVVCEEED
jgi:hypothetical protein